MTPDGADPAGPEHDDHKSEAPRSSGLLGRLSGAIKPPDFAAPGRDAFRLLFATLLVVGVGNSMLLSLLPSIARELKLSAAQMGWVFSLSALLWVLCSPFWGKRSDRWGRKPTIALGLFGYAASMAAIAAVAEIALLGWISAGAAFVGLIFARAIFGGFGSAANPAAQAYIADHTRPEARTEEIAALTSAFALGSAVGPGLCALLAAWVGPVAPLVITAVFALLSGWAVLRFLPVGAPPPPPPSTEKAITPLALALDPRVSGHLVFGLGLSTVTAVLAQTFGFYLIDRLGLSPRDAIEPTAAGFMIGALAVLTAQTTLLPRLKLEPRGLMMLGSGLIALGVLIQIVASSLGAVLFAQLIQGFGFGLARPGFTGGASLAVRPDEQGAVAGLIAGVSGAGFVVSPLLGGWLYDVAGHMTPFWICCAAATVMGVFAWRSRRLKAGEGFNAPPSQGEY
jgi:MFS family permease